VFYRWLSRRVPAKRVSSFVQMTVILKAMMT